MLEAKLEALTEAVKELTAEYKASRGASSGAKPSTGGKASDAKASKPKHTADKVKAIILKVKEKHGMDRAKEIIGETGSDDLADLLKNTDRFNDAYAAAEAALAEEASEADEGDGL